MKLFYYDITGRHGDNGIVVADTETDAIGFLRTKYPKNEYPLLGEEEKGVEDNIILLSELCENINPGLYTITVG